MARSEACAQAFARSGRWEEILELLDPLAKICVAHQLQHWSNRSWILFSEDCMGRAELQPDAVTATAAVSACGKTERLGEVNVRKAAVLKV